MALIAAILIVAGLFLQAGAVHSPGAAHAKFYETVAHSSPEALGYAERCREDSTCGFTEVLVAATQFFSPIFLIRPLPQPDLDGAPLDAPVFDPPPPRRAIA